ncbi:WD40-repeat-containing domain protein [Spinellus fusiger]|nr:WD40-repeat-containing domain protein [Spinellus fusiger]
MTEITLEKLFCKLEASQSGKNMPILCAIDPAFYWKTHPKKQKGVIKDIKTDSFCVNEEETYFTSMALSDNNNIIALGSGNPDGQLYFIKDMLDSRDAECSRFQVQQTEYLNAPIHSLDWSGNHLLVGSNKNTAKLFRIHGDFEDEDSPADIIKLGNYTSPSLEGTVQAKQLPSYLHNTFVNAVQFSPNYSDMQKKTETHFQLSNRFLSITANSLLIWDVMNERRPVSIQTTDRKPLKCANWSPHAPFSLIVTGGDSKALTIIDTRIATGYQGGVVWKAPNAHDHTIRTALFNPFIPYWVASGGEDCVANIWDIRSTYHAPVAKIDGHRDTIRSIAWSNMRPESLCTTSCDE